MTESGISGAAIQRWTNDIHQGDAAETLAEIPENSAHCVMTSPPYFGLRDYGVEGQIGLEESLDEYIDALIEVGDELRRVLRDDGNWWLNIGDSFAGSRRGQWDNDEGRPKESVSPGSGELPDREVELQRKSKMLVPHRVAIALQEAGWVVRSDAVWSKPNPMPDPTHDRLNECKEFVFHLTPAPEYWFDLDAIREPHAEASLERSGRHDHTKRDYPGNEPQTLNPEQFVHPKGKNPGDIFEVTVKSFPEAHFAVYPPELCRKPIKSSCPPKVCADCGAPYEREREVTSREVAGGVSPVPEEERGYNERQGHSQNDRDGLTQPTDVTLGEWEQACGCETDETAPGVVLDPFAGAGTTCLVAKQLGRRFIGIDLNEEYVAMGQKRVGVTVDEPELLLEDGETSLGAYTDGGKP